MSRFPSRFVASLSMLSLVGCHPPMYQQGQYGQQMYSPQGNFAPSGTIVIPQTNAPPYSPGSTYSAPPADSFQKPAEPNDGRFFNSDGEVPLPSDPGSGGARPFSNDLQQ
ncbi:MAG TPA: hypothetical protein PLR25_30255 [Planctomycetaceae bacterium]|nr:hypothetical protein [Planctomycetaceae bacterium]